MYSYSRFLVVVLCMTFMPSCIDLRSSVTDPGTMAVGALDQMTRVGMAGAITVSPGVHLFAARGEYESFQIAVTANNGPIESVSIAISDLRYGRFTIDQSSIAAYREHFVQIVHGSPDLGGANRPLGPGYYPDALIPVKQSGKPRFSATDGIDPQHRAVFWVDVFVPREASPGEYQGDAVVSSPSETATLPISLTVWRHVLPLKPSLKSSFGIDTSRNLDPRMSEFLLEHGLMPFLIDPARSDYFRNWFGLNSTGLWFFGGANNRSCTMNPAPAAASILGALAKYPADVEKYAYAADEIDCPSIFPVLKQWARNVHEAGAKLLATIAPTPELFDDDGGSGRSAVDIWVVLPKMYKKAGSLIQDALQKQNEIWSYNALVQDTYSPKWEIDFSPINYRMQAGFLNQSLNITGLLYWGVDRWNADPWENPDSFTTSGYNYPGEGLLVYPGADAGVDGPVPSMRLKWLRKGVEDYEYVEMLKKALKGDWALSLIRSVASDWDSWSRNPQDLESVRLQLGAELDQLAAQGSSSEHAPRHYHPNH